LLDRAERVFHGLAALIEDIGALRYTGLHSVQYGLVLETGHEGLRAGEEPFALWTQFGDKPWRGERRDVVPVLLVHGRSLPYARNCALASTMRF
jgi:hypothetical protein